MEPISLSDLATFAVDEQRGFLPEKDPLTRLPDTYALWERLAADLPYLLMTESVRSAVAQLKPISIEQLTDVYEWQRAMLLLSALGHAHVWNGEQPAERLPAGVAVPWWELSELLGRPPIMSHASLVLYNWRRLDPHGPLDLSNLAPLQLFHGGLDEQWFYLVTVEIEAEGAEALAAMVGAQQAVAATNGEGLGNSLLKLANVIETIFETLERMAEKCDPYIFFQRVRPILTGWESPGIIYEGVSSEPQMYVGGSAAQSALLQSLDAGLGIAHPHADTSPFLQQMRLYMEPAHRNFIAALEQGPSIRRFVLDVQEEHPALVEIYSKCMHALDKFRRKHMEIAVRYITHQTPVGEEAKGTGGTSFASFLGRANKETREHFLG